MYYVYCLKSIKDSKYYVGQTQDVQKRISEHNAGLVSSTKRRIPFELVGFEQYDTRSAAMWREHELKNSAQKRKKFFAYFAK
ncbi:MAG: hypothetical protein ACD_41C00365G0017 [uncultured bacterium]|nr:MAG: hypothetical protein ACD_41C00365G0017 [uncultured bacterium]HBY73125.1 hypothetical protein [Candidatus Kerfeldbacteria bacterium]